MSLITSVLLYEWSPKKAKPQLLRKVGDEELPQEVFSDLVFPTWNKTIQCDKLPPPPVAYPFVIGQAENNKRKLHCCTSVFHVPGEDGRHVPRAICVISTTPLLRTLMACLAGMQEQYQAILSETAFEELASRALQCRVPNPPGLAVSHLMAGNVTIPTRLLPRPFPQWHELRLELLCTALDRSLNSLSCN